MTELIPTAKYSQTLADIMAIKATKVWKYTEDHQQHLSEGKGPKHIDLGFNLYGTNEHQEKDHPTKTLSWTEPPDPNMQELLSHFKTDNRCFIIHLAAALGFSPLHLENQIVNEAIRLLTRIDLHPTKARILATILEYDGSPNANVLALVYPEIMKQAIVRIVILEDNMKIQAAIAYKDSKTSLATLPDIYILLVFPLINYQLYLIDILNKYIYLVIRYALHYYSFKSHT